MAKNVLVIGGGGREDAICWKLAQSPSVRQIYAAPGSFGIEKTDPKVRNVPALDIKQFSSIVDYCRKQEIDLVVVGPEDPLANGLADALNQAKIRCFGPEQKAARIESDKSWAKAFMDKHGIPSARWGSFTDATKAKDYIKSATHAALVVKASGLAAGKGVVVAKDVAEACAAVDEILAEKKFGSAGDTVIVEELLEGEEVSVLAFTDGKSIKAMVPAQDHKRIFEGDEGPNTGGMGAYCPCPLITPEQLKYVQENILNHALSGLQKENIHYVGVLYAGLMLTKNGIKVLEFNCRFGDPETQVILPLLESDLYQVMVACCVGTLATQDIMWKQGETAVGVVMASRGYPETSSKGQVITGVEEVAKLAGFKVFHSGTTVNTNGDLVTNGGRVLIVIARAPQLTIAAAKATNACAIIKFDGAQYRRDIAHKGIARQIMQYGSLTYKASGVDIVAGDTLVSHIKPLAKSTARKGLMGGLGGFGGLFDTKAAMFTDPILVSGTDGVGTKLKIAQACGIHNTIGIDLVAMCVNDVLAHGAEPLFFLDYFSCGELDVNIAKDVVSGVAEGCRQAGCALIGGETAEMPSMYAPGDYDLAGFAVGAVERSKMIPRSAEIQNGDVIICLPSSGVHSNGFSLVRRVMELAGVSYMDKAPFSSSGKTFGEELLTPTKIYIKSLLPALKTGHIKAFAHITGGGLLENIPRVLTKEVKVELNSENWEIPAVFGWLAALGEINEYEMLRTFNCGVGGIVVVAPEHQTIVLAAITDVHATVIGSLKPRIGDEPQVNVKYFQNSILPHMRPHISSLVTHKGLAKKRVGVLISGSGTNLQSLIDATVDPTKHIGAEIALVISNKPDVEGLKRAQRANIPTVVIKHSDYTSREAFDQAMDAHLMNAGVEIICLAGFMRIISSQFVNKWHGRLINIHPSLLPNFKGTHAQRQALEAGVKVSGCTVHFVEADIDSGAILVQETVPVLQNDTEEDLIERIKCDAEKKAYPAALKLLATGCVSLGADRKIQYHS